MGFTCLLINYPRGKNNGIFSVSDTKIDNCKFSFKCPKKWSALTDVGIDNQRYCGSCKEVVHWCDTQEEIDKAASENRCVAFSTKPTGQVKNWNSDEDGFLVFHTGRLGTPDEYELKTARDKLSISRIIPWLKRFVK